jgi:hypothetical protein
MSIPREELLKPSLSLTRATIAPYSVNTTVMVAFFGGSLGLIGITALNAWRLGRLGRDAIPLAIMLAAYLGFVWALAQTEWGMAFQTSLLKFIDMKTMSNVYRLIALILCGLSFLLHRSEQRSADVMGLDRPNGWIAGLAFIAGDILVSHLLDNILAAQGDA